MNVEMTNMEAWEFCLKSFIAMIPFWLFYQLGKACGRDEAKLAAVRGRTEKAEEN